MTEAANGFSALVSPLIGMLGVIAGTILNEYLRRGRRTEQYSSVIFNKRLDAYETLMRLIIEGSDLAETAINDAKLSKKERHELVSLAIFPIAEHVDRNVLYIDEELGPHCTSLFMSAEDIHDASESEKQQLLKHYYEMRKETFRMIAEDSGVAKINRLFRSINRPRITSPVIEAIRELRKERQYKK